jgi:hypothetical protein
MAGIEITVGKAILRTGKNGAIQEADDKRCVRHERGRTDDDLREHGVRWRTPGVPREQRQRRASATIPYL